MTISTTEQMLLIILSSALAVFLILGIVAVVKSIQILNSVKRISDKAEQIADKAENVADFFQRSTGPVIISNLLSNMFSAGQRNNKDRK